MVLVGFTPISGGLLTGILSTVDGEEEDDEGEEGAEAARNGTTHANLLDDGEGVLAGLRGGLDAFGRHPDALECLQLADLVI